MSPHTICPLTIIAAASLWLGGCATDPTLLAIPVEFEGAAVSSLEIGGVAVTLSAAQLTIGDLRLDSPATQARAWSLISTAQAHPGHDFSGDTRGELLGSWTLDLLDPAPLRLGEASCYTGDYESGHLSLQADPVGTLEGTAAAIPFAFSLALDTELTGLDFVDTIDALAPPTRILLTLDWAHALSFSDWQTPDDDGDGTLTLSDGVLGNTVPFGITSTPTWTLTLED